MLTKADKWLIVVIITAALTGIGLNMYWIAGERNQAKHVVISVDGQVRKTFPLRQGYVGEFSIADHGVNVIEYQDGRVRMKESDCPDQICVQSGWISMPQQQIVCLPYRVVVKIAADSPADVDDIVR